jgi:hypothetical protein
MSVDILDENFGRRIYCEVSPVSKRQETKWKKSNTALDHFKLHIAEKEKSGKNRNTLSIVDILHVSNFKGGNGATAEPVELLDSKLESYTAEMESLESAFGKSARLQDLSAEDVELLVERCERFTSLTKKKSETEIDGLGPSYASALLACHFINLVPILDRRVLNGASKNGLATTIEWKKDVQPKGLEKHYGELIRYCHQRLTRSSDTEYSLRKLDYELFLTDMPKNKVHCKRCNGKSGTPITTKGTTTPGKYSIQYRCSAEKCSHSWTSKV